MGPDFFEREIKNEGKSEIPSRVSENYKYFYLLVQIAKFSGTELVSEKGR